MTDMISLLESVASVDPAPFFVLSLFPYLAFLYWAQRSSSIPKIALWGFRMTLVFVLMTIIFAIIAKQVYGGELTDVDPLHGSAEAFLTISDALIALGFLRLSKNEVVNNS